MSKTFLDDNGNFQTLNVETSEAEPMERSTGKGEDLLPETAVKKKAAKKKVVKKKVIKKASDLL